MTRMTVGDGFGAVMDALAEHTETMSDREVLDDALVAGIDVPREAERLRGLLADAVQRAKTKHVPGTHAPWSPDIWARVRSNEAAEQAADVVSRSASWCRPSAVTAAAAPPTNAMPPADSGLVAERYQRAGFVGREDVLARLDDWLHRSDGSGYVVVIGSAGTGKTSIVSALLARYLSAGRNVPHHFIRRRVAERDRPEAIATSLATQIEARFPALCDTRPEPGRRLLELLGRVSKQLGAAERLVVVVDGLDETRAAPGENPLPRFLPQVVPSGIRFLCATRPTSPFLSWLTAGNLVRWLDLDDRRWASSNDNVVRRFWGAVATEYQPRLPAETINLAITRAKGNVLHAVMLHDALRSLSAQERRVARIPRGLRGLNREIWGRVASHAAVRVGLGLLCAAQESLPLDVLGELAAWGPDDKERFLSTTQQLLFKEPRSWDGVEAYRPHHDWVRELIVERLGAATMRAHHATLSRMLAMWPARPEPAARRYALRHALTHRVAAGDCAGAWRLAADMSFLEARCCELGVYETESDVAQVATHCRARNEPVLGTRFDDLAWALAREAHWLQAAPEATPALVWNRLQRSPRSVSDRGHSLRLVAERAGFLRVRSVATRQSPALVRELIGHTGFVNACAVTPDSRRIISASDDRTLKVWDLDSGRLLDTFEGHTGRVTACAVTGDGRRIVSASDDRTLRVWDVDRGRLLGTLDGHTDAVAGCAVTPDGRRVVSASADQTLRVWDPETGRAVAILEGHTRRVNACAVTPDGRRAVSASTDRTLRIWDLATGNMLATLEGHTEPVMSCAVTSDGRRVVSASWERTLKVWDLERGVVLGTLEGHDSSVHACVVTADGRRVVSASSDRTVKLWDLDTSRVLVSLEGHSDGVTACAVTVDGRRVVSASWRDPVLKVWDLEREQLPAAREGHSASVHVVAISRDGRRAVSAANDETLKVWDVESGHPVGHQDAATTPAVATDGQRVISAGRGETTRTSDVDSDRVHSVLQGRARLSNACAVVFAGQRVIAVSDDGSVQTWDLECGRARTPRDGDAKRVTAHAVTPDGRRVVVAFQDRGLKIYDLDDGSVRVLPEAHANLVTACAATPDGRRVVSASADRSLKVWDLETGRGVATLIGHTYPVTACLVTADGRRVVSASRDGKLKVWDLESGRSLATLKGHDDAVTACTLTAEGRRVVSASEDRTLKVWDLDTYACLLTHRGDAAYTAVASTADAIVAGDKAGGIWFLDWPSLDRAAPPEADRAVAGVRVKATGLPRQGETVDFTGKLVAPALYNCLGPLQDAKGAPGPPSPPARRSRRERT